MGGTGIVRNSILLALSMAALSISTQLNAAFGAVTFVGVGGSNKLVGLAPAFTLLPVAIGALFGGAAMDRFGRIPVLAAGFAVGIGGALVASHASSGSSLAELMVGFVLLGLGQGIGMLSRVAAADMYPPHRRALGMAIVMMGAVVGAMLGPLVLAPSLHGTSPSLDQLADAWLHAGGALGVGFLLTLAVRPDPGRGRLPAADARRVAEQLPVAEVIRRRGVRPALAAASASYAVMIAMMWLAGHVALGKGQEAQDVLEAVAAHVTGMYAFGLGAGYLIDRDGPRRWIVVGLVLVAGSAFALAMSESALALVASMFVLGLGWCFAFVAASAALVQEASTSQRGRVLGISDLLAAVSGAALVLMLGTAMDSADSLAVGVAMAAVSLAPVPFVLLSSRRAVVAEPAHARAASRPPTSAPPARDQTPP